MLVLTRLCALVAHIGQTTKGNEKIWLFSWFKCFIVLTVTRIVFNPKSCYLSLPLDWISLPMAVLLLFTVLQNDCGTNKHNRSYLISVVFVTHVPFWHEVQYYKTEIMANTIALIFKI